MPPEIVIVTMLHEDQSPVENRLEKERVRLKSRLTSIRNRMDSAYVDKLDGKTPENFWERKMTEDGRAAGEICHGRSRQLRKNRQGTGCPASVRTRE